MGEERTVASHYVEQERLVGRWSLTIEKRFIVEIHAHGLHANSLTGGLYAELQRKTLVGLHTDDDGIRVHRISGHEPEKQVRHPLELNRDFRYLLRHALAGA